MDKHEMSKTKATFLILLSGLAAVVSALGLHGWHVYVALALIGAALAIGFFLRSRR